ncbi:MAG: DUF2283 domain-containing protein [Candidatus Natronoplasma sp.]
MRVKVDMESNALYFRLSEEEIVESEETSSGVILDYDKDGRVVGIEILNIKNQFSIEDLSNMKVELPTTKAG